MNLQSHANCVRVFETIAKPRKRAGKNWEA